MTAALHLARACRDAYMPPLGYIIAGDGFCRATVTRHRNIVTIAFQGTSAVNQWGSNFDFTLVQHGPGRVSRGFLTSFLNVRDKLMMAAMPDDGDTLLITGHSRGAPHACLMAATFAKMGIVPAATVTFASPRWCDTAYGRHIDSLLPEHHRYVFESDVVPRLPFTIFGHAHCGTLHWFDGSAWRARMPLITRLGVYLFNRRWPLIGNNVADHHISEYITALEQFQ